MKKSLIILIILSLIIMLHPPLFEDLFSKDGTGYIDVVEVNQLLKELEA